MPERTERILKLLCVALAAVLLFQGSRLVINRDSLAHLSIPALPALAATAEGPGDQKMTNSAPHAPSGEGITITNSAASKELGKNETNSAPAQHISKQETNSASAQESGRKETNSNSVAVQDKGAKNTNSTPAQSSGDKPTNSVPAPAAAGKAPKSPPRPGPAMKPADLPPVIQARIDRIIESEILGPVMRPLPMALLGIAGKDAFLRAPNGQTGLVKEGDELGGVKLLQIGINRVLVEEDGQKKELTVFSGFGSETLLSKPTESSNETIQK